MGKSKVTVTISSDATGFKTGLREAETGLAGFSSGLTNTGQNLMKFGGLMTLGITAPAGLAAKAVFDAATDMGESMSKVSVVFGSASDEVVAWSKNSAQAMGISQQAALEAAGTYGNLFQAFGIGQAPAQEMSTSLVQLASDLASFNNTSTEEAIDALRSGLSGETEPLKRYGVALSDVRLKEEAVAQGLIKSTKDALTPAAKSQAAYALIMKDTTLAQGDFSRTADGAANKQRILAAQFQNAKASIGQGLLPVANQLLNVIGKLLDGFNGISPSMQKVILIGVGVAAAIGPITTGVGALAVGLGFLLSPIGLIVGGLALVAAGFVYLYNTSEPVRKAIDGLVGSFKDFDLDNIGASLKNVAANLSNVLTEGLAGFGDMLANIDWAQVTTTLLDGLDQLKDTAFEFLKGIDWGGIILELGRLLGSAFESLGNLLTNIDWKKVFSFILELAGDLLTLLAGIDWGKVAAGIGTALLGALKLIFISLPKGVLEMFVGLFSAVGDLFDGDMDWGDIAGKIGGALLKLLELVFVDLPVKIWELASGALVAAWEFITDIDWGELAGTIGEAYLGLLKTVWIDLPKKVFSLIVDGLKAAWEFITDIDWGELAGTIGEAYLGLMRTIWVDLPSKIGELIGKGVKAAFNWAVDNGGDLLDKLTTFFTGLPKKIGDFFKNAGTWLKDAGKDIIDGLIDGAGSVLKKIGTFFLDKVPDWIKTPFKKALGISSPSKLFAEYGKNLVDGLVIGLENTAPLDRAMQKLAGSTTLNLAGANTASGATVIHNYITVEAKMLEPSLEAGRVIEASLKDLQLWNGR